MNFTDVTIKDDTLGAVFTVTAEIIDWGDDTFPQVTINSISYCEKPIDMWAFNESYLTHLKNKVFQKWCAQGKAYA